MLTRINIELILVDEDYIQSSHRDSGLELVPNGLRWSKAVLWLIACHR